MGRINVFGSPSGIDSAFTFSRAGAAAAIFIAITACELAAGQAQLRVKGTDAVNSDGRQDVKAPLRGMSLFLVEAPPPKTFAVHDLITIIINETSKQSSQQKLDTKTDASLKGGLSKFPSLSKLLEAELTNGGNSPIAEVDVGGSEKFKGDAKYERNDRFTDKVTAEVIDVKPNGVLVLEARRTIGRDKEIQTIVLCGMCRREDVTNANSILSSQLADLTMRVENEGKLRDSNEPGWISRLLGTIFDF